MTPTKMRNKEPMVDLFRKVSPTYKEKRHAPNRARKLPRLAFTSDGWIDFKALRAINAGSLDSSQMKKGAGHGKNRKILNSTEGQDAL
jgi:hypothetical protein